MVAMMVAQMAASTVSWLAGQKAALKADSKVATMA